MKRFFKWLWESWWIWPACLAGTAVVGVAVCQWLFRRAWDAAMRTGGVPEGWQRAQDVFGVGHFLLLAAFAGLSVLAVLVAAIRWKWRRALAAAGAFAGSLAVAFLAVCCGLVWGGGLCVIRGEYSADPPPFEEVEQDWSLIYYDILPAALSVDWDRHLVPLPNGNFLLAVQGGDAERIARKYHERKAQGGPPGRYPYNRHLWTEWGPSEEAEEVRIRTGHWPLRE